MRFFALLLAASCLGALAHELPAEAPAAERGWSQWRGPLATGVAPHANPPLEWSEEKNLRWKVALPGTGHSTPAVWGDRLFVTAAVPYGDPVAPSTAEPAGAHDNLPVTRRYEFVVMAIARSDGRILWRRTVHRGLPHEMGHQSASLASASPSTDGERVYAFFGSYGLYALSVNGDPEWSVDFGRMHTKHGHGEGSSPALHGDTLIVNWDHEEGSFVTALDTKTGKSRWRAARDEVTSWATPIVVEHEGRKQVIVPGTQRLRSYDLATGAVIWECAGLSANIVASPVAANGMIYAASSYDTRALLAIRLAGAKGDITGSEQVAWQRSRGTPYVPSLLLSNGALYYLGHYQGILSRVDAATGEDRPGTFRLPSIGNVYASPVAAAGRVYITDREGTTVVLSDEDRPRVLAVNQLTGTFSASAALADGEIYLRSADSLYCIAEQAAPAGS
jgi:outer membrane protein assembly factor BamB